LRPAQVGATGPYGAEPDHEPRDGGGPAILSLVGPSLPLIRQPHRRELGGPFGRVPAGGLSARGQHLDVGATRSPEACAAVFARIAVAVRLEGSLGPSERARSWSV